MMNRSDADNARGGKGSQMPLSAELKGKIVQLLEECGARLDRRIVQLILLRWQMGGRLFTANYLREESPYIFANTGDRERLLTFLDELTVPEAEEAIEEVLRQLPWMAPAAVRESARAATSRFMACGCPAGYHSEDISTLQVHPSIQRGDE